MRSLPPRGRNPQAPTRQRPFADMEGPAVKRFVTAPSISSSMSRSGYFSGGPERFPEDADARLTMERLRRRIRLICADYSEEQSRMTPLRRELPVVLASRRGRRRSGISEPSVPWTSRLGHDGYAAARRLSCRVMAAQMNPTSSRATAATATGVRLPWPTRWR